MKGTFLAGRIQFIEAEIVRFEGAIAGLVDGTLESYDFDSGQTRQRATRHELDQITKHLKALYALHDVLEASYTGNGVVVVQPCF